MALVRIYKNGDSDGFMHGETKDVYSVDLKGFLENGWGKEKVIKQVVDAPVMSPVPESSLEAKPSFEPAEEPLKKSTGTSRKKQAEEKPNSNLDS